MIKTWPSALALLAIACGDPSQQQPVVEAPGVPPVVPPEAPRYGTLRLTVPTHGADVDSSFTVVLDGVIVRDISSGLQLDLQVAAGSHRVSLNRVEWNCTADAGEVAVTVEASNTTLLELPVTCTPFAYIRVSTSINDGREQRQITAECSDRLCGSGEVGLGSATLRTIAGTHSLEIRPRDTDCAPVDRTVTAPAGDTVAVSIAVYCSSHPVDVRVSVRSSGRLPGLVVNYSQTAPSGCQPVYGCIGLIELDGDGDHEIRGLDLTRDVYFYLTPWDARCMVTSTNPVRLTMDEWRVNEIVFDVSCP